MPTKVLVVGGAGFIGAHMTLALQEKGYETVVFDNFSTGHREAVFGPLFEGNLLDRDALKELFSQHTFDAAFHFAASTAVGESVVHPDLYYRNNVVGTLNLLEALVQGGVKHLVFSSTAAVYGEPRSLPLDEREEKRPLNPYGKSKWMIETLLPDYAHAYGLRAVALRYFNAAGCDPKGRTGERRAPVSHLIPIALEVALDKRPCFELFGTDYPTEDGTCVRDFVHVCDLCAAHLLALEMLRAGGEGGAYNLGSEKGYSVKEVIAVVERVTGKKLPLRYAPRRPGDPAHLVADATKARKELGWKAERSDLESMVCDTWKWLRSELASLENLRR